MFLKLTPNPIKLFALTLVALISIIGAGSAQAQYVEYLVDISATLTNTNVNGNTTTNDQRGNYWKSGSIQYDYTQLWYSTDGGLNVAPEGPGYVSTSNSQGVTNRPTVGCGTSFTGNCATKTNYSAAWQQGLSSNSVAITSWSWVAGPDEFTPGYFTGLNFTAPGIKNAYNRNGTSFYLTGVTSSTATVNEGTTGSGGSPVVTAPIIYTGGITWSNAITVTAPEMDGGLWPQISLLLSSLFFIARRRKAIKTTRSAA